jgi:hypothetical protein
VVRENAVLLRTNGIGPAVVADNFSEVESQNSARNGKRPRNTAGLWSREPFPGRRHSRIREIWSITSAMTILIVTAVLGAWVALSLLGGETQRQKQDLELAERIAARRAAQKAADEAAQAAEGHSHHKSKR